MKTILALALIAPALYAAQPASSSIQGIPRVSTRHFVREGLYEGGDHVKANVEGLRLAAHPGGIERWVLDFSDAAGKEVGKTAPRFRLRYEAADSAKRQAPRFVLNLREIQTVKVTREQLSALAKKSKYVREVVLYPPVEDGDLAMELILRSNVRFEPHQPLEKSGRLVLDLMQAP